MKKRNRIHTLDALEKEILARKLDVKEKAKELERNFNHLQQNFSSYFMGSFSCRSQKEENTKHGFFDSIFGNEYVRSTVSGIGERVAEKAGNVFERLMERLFQKHK